MQLPEVLFAGKLCKELFLGGDGFADLCDNGVFVKIGIGDSCEKILNYHMINIRRDFRSFAAKCSGDGGEPFCYINEKILHGCHIRSFSADTGYCAAGAAGSFLTLIAKHFLFHYIYLL